MGNCLEKAKNIISKCLDKLFEETASRGLTRKKTVHLYEIDGLDQSN